VTNKKLARSNIEMELLKLAVVDMETTLEFDVAVAEEDNDI